MSLDVDLMVTQPVSVYSGNITHNLGKMAREVKFGIEWTGLKTYCMMFSGDLMNKKV
jgi:hypothetical protein